MANKRIYGEFILASFKLFAKSISGSQKARNALYRVSHAMQSHAMHI